MSVIQFGGGRPPKPTEVKRRQGTLKTERVNPNELVRSPTPLGPPPEHLSELEKGEWVKFSARIDPLNISTDADVEAFAQLVTAASVCESARRTLFDPNENPMGITTYESMTTSGGLKICKRPEIEVLAQFQKLLAHWMSRFGLTPADRQRVDDLGEDQDDPLEEFKS